MATSAVTIAPGRSIADAAVTHAQLVRDWRATLDAFGEALEFERRYLTPFELKQFERHLAADRRWLRRFAAVRTFPGS